MTARFPARRFYGESMQTSLLQLQAQRDILNAKLDKAGYAGRRVLGYKLPEWQRPEVWTDSQCVKFIESVWLGVGLGSFMVNTSYHNANLDDILLDGQQRLRAIERYWNDEFTVAGDDGQHIVWTQFAQEEHNHFLRIPFPWVWTQYHDETLLKEAYNRHNFGGTVHTENQRA